MQQLLWQTVQHILKKLKTDVPYEPAIPLNIASQGNIYIFVFVITFTEGKSRSNLNILTDKENMAYVHNGIIFTLKRERNFYYTPWMSLEECLLSELSQSQDCGSVCKTCGCREKVKP